MKFLSSDVKPEEYAHATAIVTHATIKRSLEQAYPELSSDEQDQMFLTIIDHIARLRGHSLRPNKPLRGTFEEDYDE